MRNELNELAFVMRMVSPVLLNPLLERYAPSCPRVSLLKFGAAEAAAVIRDLKCGPVQEFERFREVLTSINDVTKGVRVLALGWQYADRLGLAVRISAELPKGHQRLINLVAWARLYDKALWRVYYAEGVEDYDATQAVVGEEGRTYRFTVSGNCDYIGQDQTEQRKSRQTFKEIALSLLRRKTRCENPVFELTETQSRKSILFHVRFTSYTNPAYTGFKFSHSTHMGELLIDYSPEDSSLVATSSEDRTIVRSLVGLAVSHMLNAHLNELTDRNYDLTRFATPKGAELPLPKDVPYNSVRITELAVSYPKGETAGRFCTFKGDCVYKELAETLKKDHVATKNVSVSRVTLSLALPHGGLSVRVELTRKSRRIVCPVGCGRSIVIRLLSDWGLDGIEKDEIKRPALSTAKVSNLLTCVGFGNVKLKQRGNSWVTNTLSLPGGERKNIVIAETAKDFAMGSVEGVKDPILLTVDGRIPRDEKLKKILNGCSSIVEALGYRFQVNAEGVVLTKSGIDLVSSGESNEHDRQFMKEACRVLLRNSELSIGGKPLKGLKDAVRYLVRQKYNAMGPESELINRMKDVCTARGWKTEGTIYQKVKDVGKYSLTNKGLAKGVKARRKAALITSDLKDANKIDPKTIPGNFR